MNKQTLLGLLRHLLTFGGGYLVAQGYADDAGAQELIGGIITVIGGVWSIIEKRNAKLAAAAKVIPMLILFCLVQAVLFLGTGCASFKTVQRDISYENGQKVREITTKAGGGTFFSGKSSLASWKASQTDKTQGATVGNLVQDGGQTNQVADLVGAAVGAAVKAAATAAK